MTFATEEDMYFERIFADSEDDEDEVSLSPREINDMKEQAAYERWKERREDALTL
jgi:hypothetical protein